MKRAAEEIIFGNSDLEIKKDKYGVGISDVRQVPAPQGEESTSLPLIWKSLEDLDGKEEEMTVAPTSSSKSTGTTSEALYDIRKFSDHTYTTDRLGNKAI